MSQENLPIDHITFMIALRPSYALTLEETDHSSPSSDVTHRLNNRYASCNTYSDRFPVGTVKFQVDLCRHTKRHLIHNFSLDKYSYIIIFPG